MARKLKDFLNVPTDQLDQKVGLSGYQGKSPCESVKYVVHAHLEVQGLKVLNQPFIEADTTSDITVGSLWLARHRALVDCRNVRLVWEEGAKPLSAPPTKDIVADLKDVPAKGIKPRPDHQYDADRRDALLQKEDKRRRDGKNKRVTIAAIRLVEPPPISRASDGNTFATDQKGSYRKMEEALHNLNRLVRSPGTASDSLPARRIDTAGLRLEASTINTRIMAFWARQARRQRAVIGVTTLAEIDKQLDHLWQKRLEESLPEEETVDVKELIEQKLPPYLHDLADVCSKVQSDKLPPHRASDHKIKLIDDSPLPVSPIYHLSLEHLQLMKEYLQENLAKGFISKSQSPFASPVLFAKKPGGGWRFCVDYRKLNAKTEVDAYPLPLIDEVLDKLRGAVIFTKVDVRQAFNRIRLHPDSVPLTAFRTRYGTYHYNVLPFGLCNGPATFQRYINEVLFELLDECCTAYVDDILIYSQDPLEHELHVRKVFERLRAAGLQVDIKKSEFSVTRTKFLGFIISTEGIAVDPDKISAITDWREPETVKGVQSFLGFCNFYRRFVRDFGFIALPLIQLTKKGTPFRWEDSQQEAFDRLKLALTTAPVLVHFDPNAETMIETDASGGVAAGVLSQLGLDGFWHPVAFFSKTLTPAEMRYDIHDKELLAVILGLKKWKPDLLSTRQPFLIITDHKALEYFTEKKILNDRQIGWTEFLADFSYKITYRAGKQNILADTLTRKLEDLRTQKAIRDASRTAQLLPDETLTVPVSAVTRSRVRPDQKALPAASAEDSDSVSDTQDVPNASDDEVPVAARDPEGGAIPPAVNASQELGTETPVTAAAQDDQLQGFELIDAILKANRESRDDPEARAFWRKARGKEGGWDIKLGLLTRDDKLFVPVSDANLRTHLIDEIHSRMPTAHPGREKTKQLVMRQYYWPTVSRDTVTFWNNCRTCHRSKNFGGKKPGLLHPLPIPQRPWLDVSMDFAEFPPDRKGYDNLFVSVCRLGKRSISIPCRKTATAQDAAFMYYTYVWRIYGMPRSITSDRGPQFISAFMDELCRLTGTKQKLSTANHAQTNGNTEIINRYIKQRIRPFISHFQDDWSDRIPAMDFAQAVLPHESTGIAPAELELGFLPRMSYDWKSRTADEDLEKMPVKERLAREEAQVFARRTKEVIVWAQENLRQAQERQTYQANKHRRIPDFDVGDSVYLSKTNLRTLERPSKKLDFPNDGPFKILKKIGHSYLLDLPARMKIHPVLHADRLRKAAMDPLPGQRQEEPPPDIVFGQEEWEVKEILASRLYYKKLQYKVRWHGWDDDHEWYHASNFKGSPQLLKEFHETYPSLPGPPVRLADWQTAWDNDEDDPPHKDDNKPVPPRPLRVATRPGVARRVHKRAARPL